jgi:hypothetical protein
VSDAEAQSSIILAANPILIDSFDTIIPMHHGSSVWATIARAGRGPILFACTIEDEASYGGKLAPSWSLLASLGNKVFSHVPVLLIRWRKNSRTSMRPTIFQNSRGLRK